MIISINARWRVRTDEHQRILETRLLESNAKKPWRSVAYCGNLGTALHVAAERQIFSQAGEYPPTALKPLCEALSAIREDITRALVGITTDPAAFHGRAAQ